MRHVLRIKNTNYCKPPSADEMLQHELWELHEAAFFLSEWPEFLVKTDCIDQEIPRVFFYEAAPPPEHLSFSDWEFSANSLTKHFALIYDDLLKAIYSGEIKAKIQNVGLYSYGWKSHKLASYLINSREVLDWAYQIGINLPVEIQKKLGISISTEKKLPRSKIKIKITGQFLRRLFPNEIDNFYIQHPFMKMYGNNYDRVIGDRAVEKYLQELKKPKESKKQGNRTRFEKTSIDYCPLKPINEVVKISKGEKKFNIPAFRIAMNTCARIVGDRYIENVYFTLKNPGIKDLQEFLYNYFLKDEVVNVYLENIPAYLKEIAIEIAFRYMNGIFNFNEKNRQ